MASSRRMLTLVSVILMVLYPFLVYLGLSHFEPRLLALLLVVVLSLRLLTSLRGQALLAPRHQLLLLMAGLLLVLVTLLGNVSWGLKLYPVVINLVFLGIFAWSLRYPPTLIERLARLRDPDLPPRAVVYTRQVTRVWCFFFAINGGLALYTALWGSTALWTLYNGLIAYILIGSLLGGEFLYRRYWLKKHGEK